MNNLLAIFDLLSDISTKANTMDKTLFGALYSMILEEYCKANDEDIVEFIDDIHRTVHEVNALLGKY